MEMVYPTLPTTVPPIQTKPSLVNVAAALPKKLARTMIRAWAYRNARTATVVVLRIVARQLIKIANRFAAMDLWKKVRLVTVIVQQSVCPKNPVSKRFCSAIRINARRAARRVQSINASTTIPVVRVAA